MLEKKKERNRMERKLKNGNLHKKITGSFLYDDLKVLRSFCFMFLFTGSRMFLFCSYCCLHYDAAITNMSTNIHWFVIAERPPYIHRNNSITVQFFSLALMRVRFLFQCGPLERILSRNEMEENAI